MRVLCAEALGGVEKPSDEVIKGLMAALEDREAGVRQQTAFALSRIGSAGKSAAPSLIELLKNKEMDPDSRALAAQALGEMGADGKSAISALIAALMDEDDFVRQEAAAALGGIGSDAKEAKEALTELTRDAKSNVSRAAKRALNKIQ
jgi:HEAT repeat protein